MQWKCPDLLYTCQIGKCFYLICKNLCLTVRLVSYGSGSAHAQARDFLRLSFFPGRRHVRLQMLCSLRLSFVYAVSLYPSLTMFVLARFSHTKHMQPLQYRRNKSRLLFLMTSEYPSCAPTALHQEEGDETTTPGSMHPDQRWFKEYRSICPPLVIDLVFVYSLMICTHLLFAGMNR